MEVCIANQTTGRSAMRAAGPATWPAHSFFELRAHPFDMLASCLIFFDGDGPADPLVPREGRYVLPCRTRIRVGCERLSEIGREVMYDTSGDQERGHSVISADVCLLEPSLAINVHDRGTWSRCITSEDEVGVFGLLVAREAGLHESSVGRFAVLEVCEAPASGCCVLFGIFDHELNVCGRAGNERLNTTEDFVVFVRRDAAVMQGSNEGAIRERQLPFAVGLERYIVGEDSTKAVEIAFFVGHGNPLPIAVPVRNFGDVGRGGWFIHMCWRGDDKNDKAGDCCSSDHEEGEAFHRSPPLSR
jgi:hypothetical protein